MTDGKCCCSDGTVTVLACSGGSNVGQLTNEAAKRLDAEGVGKFFCLAGVGGHVSGMVASVAGSDKVLAIDGCPIACARKTLDAAGLDGYAYVVVTDLGIEKAHDFNLPEEHIDKVASACRAGLNGLPAAKSAGECKSSGGCCGH